MTQEIFLLLIFLSGLIAGFIAVYSILWARLKSAKSLQNQTEQIKIDLSASTERITNLTEQLSQSKSENEILTKENQTLTTRVAILSTEKSGMEKQMEQHTEDLRKMREQFARDFELLANKIFEEKSEKFSIQNRASIDQILTPLKENIAAFQKKIEETHHSNLKETSGLRQELKNLREMSQRMTDEAENLTRALKNDTKIQGNWGEMILESILEKSGLAKNREYFIQKSFTLDNDRRLQPDVVIRLPEEKCVVVDSKVSLKAYEQYVSEEDPDCREDHLNAHLQSIRRHMKGLSEKKYQELGEGKTLDFILMFIPVEPAYLLALNRDPGLFNEAYDKHIVLVSPSTLIASLKIIASTWKYEYQNRNAQEIASRGKFLLEKFVGFAEDFEKVGEQINRADQSYREAMKKLRDGRGSLVSQALKLENLGVKPDKKLSATFTDRDAAEDETND